MTATALPLNLSEAAFQSTVIELAMYLGWRVCHIRPAVERSGRWSTPYEGHPGLPDLILARDGVVLLVELKSQSGRPTPQQRSWLAAAGAYGHLWKPSDWPTVQTVLRGAA